MATPQRAMSQPPDVAWRAGQPLVWVLWILISITGAVVGAVVAWRIRLLIPDSGSDSVGQSLRYVATIANLTILSGAQWLLLRRCKLDVYWWVPATVAAALVAGIIVIPAVLRPFATAPGVVPSATTAILGSGLALGASGLITGAAQASVLRPTAGNIAFAWVPATVIGNALAGAVTAVVSQQLFAAALPSYLALSLLAGVGSLLVATSQAPVLLRLVR